MLDFGRALSMMRIGNRVARAEWAGTGEALSLVDGGVINVRDADGKIRRVWNPSQVDILSRDWHVVAPVGVRKAEAA